MRKKGLWGNTTHTYGTAVAAPLSRFQDFVVIDSLRGNNPSILPLRYVKELAVCCFARLKK